MATQMTQTAIPYVLMRGGTSRGPYFNRVDLPADRETLSAVLVSVIGSGNALNIDGIGGGNSVTTKVAMLSRSDVPGVDIDYFFAQVNVMDRTVDYAPTCGNILCGVGAAAVELGLAEVTGPTTTLTIRATNTGARITTTIATPDGAVSYDGETVIDGVPGTSAPVELQFNDVVGSLTGALLPTGNATDVIASIPVTCLDVAVPMVIARADSFGLTGYETPLELDENRAFMMRMEAVRQEASQLMGLGDATGRVTPKFGLLAAARDEGSVAARYFVPHHAHPTMAVTGGQCLAACLLVPDSVGAGFADLPDHGPTQVALEHPSGKLDVVLDYTRGPEGLDLRSAGLIRTCRKLAQGHVFVPRHVWS